MITCPSCGSSRIRNDYKPAPLLLRVVGIRALLCDNCNFQFHAFSPVAPKSRRPKHSKPKADTFAPAKSVDLDQLDFNPPVVEQREPKLTLPISPSPSPALPIGQISRQMSVTGVATAPPQSRVEITAPKHDLQTIITKLYAKEAKAELKGEMSAEVESLTPACPECGSRHVKRRKRNFLERLFLSFNNNRPYNCRKCDASFYSQSAEKD
ncbi:MAG: hypothetical protein ACKVZH_03340 [Blastocatellia bacterium]